MLSELIYFLKHPKINDVPISLNLKKSALLIIQSILLYVGVLALSTLLFLPLLKLLNLFPKFGMNHSNIPLSFKVLILIPLFEEIIFRLPLRFSKQNFFLFLAGFNFLIFYHTYDTRILSIVSCIIAIIPYLKLISEPFDIRMKLIWEKHFFLLFYGFAFGFGLIHMSNFVNLNFEHYLLFPFIVSNQIAMGLIFGYVRVINKNGFILCVLLHIIINFPFILIAHL